MNNVFHAQVRYIGDDSSLGFMSGREYAVEISQSYWRGRFSVVPVHGYEYRTTEDMRCYFDNLYYMLQCFEIVRVINGPTNWRRDREDYLSQQ